MGGGGAGSINDTSGVSDSGTLAFDASSGTFSQNISGSGGVTQMANTLTLTGSNTYTGATAINAGELVLGNADAVEDSSVTVNVANGLGFATGISTFIVGGLAGSGNFAVGSGVTLQVGTMNTPVNTTTYSGVLSGSGSLCIGGPDTLIFTGADTYSGSTTISQGTLQIGSGGSAGSISGTAITDNGSLVFDRSDTPNYSGVISGSGSLTQGGSGTLTLTGANTYWGATTITAGTLQIGSGGSISNSMSITDDGSLVFDCSTSTTHMATISGNGSLTQKGGGTLTLTGNDSLGGSLTQEGSTLTLSGSDSFTMGTTINQGDELQIGNGGSTGSISGNITDNGSLVFDSSMWTTCSASINGGGTLTQEGSGTLTLTGSDTYSGATTINPNTTLQVGNGTTGGLGCTSGITNYGSLVLDTNGYYMGAISGGGGLTVSGGTVYLNAANAYSGVTIWGGGTLELCGTTASLNYIVSDCGTRRSTAPGRPTSRAAISGPGSLVQERLRHARPHRRQHLIGTTTIMWSGTLQLGNDPRRLHQALYGQRHRLRNPAFDCPVGLIDLLRAPSPAAATSRRRARGTLNLSNGSNTLYGLSRRSAAAPWWRTPPTRFPPVPASRWPPGPRWWPRPAAGRPPASTASSTTPFGPRRRAGHRHHERQFRLS